jgi:hypothetical protein
VDEFAQPAERVTEHVRIVRGVPTDEELAALVGVLRSLPSGTPVTPVPEGRWARSARPGALEHGPAAWRAAALPRPA